MPIACSVTFVAAFSYSTRRFSWSLVASASSIHLSSSASLVYEEFRVPM
jgi:hypothetical protein